MFVQMLSLDEVGVAHRPIAAEGYWPTVARPTVLPDITTLFNDYQMPSIAVDAPHFGRPPRVVPRLRRPAAGRCAHPEPWLYRTSPQNSFPVLLGCICNHLIKRRQPRIYFLSMVYSAQRNSSHFQKEQAGITWHHISYLDSPISP